MFKLIFSYYNLLNEYKHYFLNRNQEGHLYALLLNAEQLWLLPTVTAMKVKGDMESLWMTPTSAPHMMPCYDLCYFLYLFTFSTLFASYTNNVCQTCCNIALLQQEFTLDIYH